MSSSQRLREAIVRRLAAVSDDICSAFQQTVDGYKTEMDRQRRLLDVVWKPDIQLHRTDLQLLLKEEPGPAAREGGPGEPGPAAREGGPGEPGPAAQEGEPSPAAREGGPGPDREKDPGTGSDQQGSSQNQENVEDSSRSVKESAEPERPGEAGAGKMCAECHVCGKTFKLTFHLNRHLRSHAHKKPYLCQP